MDKHERKIFIEKLVLIAMLCIFIGCIALAVVNYHIIGSIMHKLWLLTYPFIIGLAIAYLLTPICNKIENYMKNHKKYSKLSSKKIRFRAVFVTEFAFMSLLIIIIILLIQNLVNSGQHIIESLPHAWEQTKLYIDSLLKDNVWLSNKIGNTADEMFTNIYNVIKNNAETNIDMLLTKAATGVTNIVIAISKWIFGIIISIFALANRKQFKRQIKNILQAICSDRLYNFIISEAIIANDKFSGFFLGKIIDSLIVGIITFIVMSLFRMPYVVIVSIIIFVTNIIPIVGPFIGAIPSIIIIFSESPIAALYFTVFIIILQQLDGHIIGPKCIGNATGLNTFWVLFAIIFFGGLWGICGMLIGVPLMAVIYDVIKQAVNYRLETKKLKSIEKHIDDKEK